MQSLLKILHERGLQRGATSANSCFWPLLTFNSPLLTHNYALVLVSINCQGACRHASMRQLPERANSTLPDFINRCCPVPVLQVFRPEIWVEETADQRGRVCRIIGNPTIDLWRLKMAPWRHTNPGGATLHFSLGSKAATFSFTFN
jgi:hypothetical protein